MARRGENIYKRTDGRYEGRYIKGRLPNGKAVYGYVYAKSYVEVKEKLVSCRLHITTASCTSSSGMKLQDWIERWLGEPSNRKPSTQALYIRHAKQHIIPSLGNLRLRDLNGGILQKFVNNLSLAPATVKLIFSILKSALMTAQEYDLMDNVWSRVCLPKKQKPQTLILTPPQQQRLESVLTEDIDVGVLICLYAGLRIGEVCALQWKDIDLNQGLLCVTGTQSRIGGQLQITPPKSRTSNRVIPIPDVLLNRLRELNHYGSFVLMGQKGMMDLRSYRRRFKRLLDKAGLPDIKFHSLRHTFASRALEVGMDYKTLSEILGHASVAITMDLYVHSLDEHKRSQMNKLNQLYLPSE